MNRLITDVLSVKSGPSEKNGTNKMEIIASKLSARISPIFVVLEKLERRIFEVLMYTINLNTLKNNSNEDIRTFLLLSLSLTPPSPSLYKLCRVLFSSSLFSGKFRCHFCISLALCIILHNNGCLSLFPHWI